MTVQQLQHQIGQLQARAARIARNLELTDRIAELPGHPDAAQAAEEAARMRESLTRLYTRMHHLESRIPTADTLSHAAYHRALALGLEVEAAEAIRAQTYREARHQRLAA